MIILGIDPGSVTTGWALLDIQGNKIKYLDSGVLKFNAKTDFLNRITEIQKKFKTFLTQIKIDEIAIESLIYVKSPTSLMKLAQTRGVFLGCLSEDYGGKIFEYSPNLIKSTAVGHGHADKEGVRKFLDTLIGKIDYKTHDESDAVAIAVCHVFNRNRILAKLQKTTSSRGGGLSKSLAHKIG